jgi:hypothetical protein
MNFEVEYETIIISRLLLDIADDSIFALHSNDRRLDRYEIRVVAKEDYRAYDGFCTMVFVFYIELGFDAIACMDPFSSILRILLSFNDGMRWRHMTLKIIRKGSLVLILLFFALTSLPLVNAWFAVNHATYITIDRVDEPYYLDLLIQKPEAPLLYGDQIAALLPADYVASPFVQALNGVRDADGFVSLRLYPERYTTITTMDEHTIKFTTNRLRPLSFKIVLVFEDGSKNVTPILIQNQFTAQITYDMETIRMQASPDSEIYEYQMPEGDRNSRFWDFGHESVVVYGILIAFVSELFLLFLFGYRKG